MSLADLPPVREALEAAGLYANKAFGQHFLLDLNITRKIARLAGPLEGRAVIEVGPGPGGLTRALLEAGASVLVIEKDLRFIPLLEDIAAVADGRLTLVGDDALDAHEARLLAEAGLTGPPAVVSNLPYNVGTPLLLKWLTGPFRPPSLTLMFQKEVALRIVARPGEEHYGRLAVICAALTDAHIVMDLPARAFTPPPKVDSAVVRLDRREGPPADPVVDALQRVTAAAFGQRRKMLRSSLKALGGEGLCETARVEPTARGEEIDLAGFLRLAEAVAAG
jgi:16S rRNA (adenine1518-N6/adenine1519-N6)-dimethyltransferase